MRGRVPSSNDGARRFNATVFAAALLIIGVIICAPASLLELA
jgi:hypothetical protein